MLVFGVVHVVLVVRDQISIELAAREGARAASVSASPAAAASAAANDSTRLDPIDVSTAVTAQRVRVTVSHTTVSGLPLLGLVVGDIELSASVEMAREPP